MKQIKKALELRAFLPVRFVGYCGNGMILPRDQRRNQGLRVASKRVFNKYL